jgi:Response regulators consisting of a CheY-like receiver domain and a winged-helix DNA-binding domain
MAHILVVEDEISINALICKTLTCVGHTCDQAFDGKTALQMANAKPYDLLILDVMLPEKNGYEVLNEISGNTAIIFLTARDSLNDKVKGLNLGADDYIVKPFETLELIARIDAVLRRLKKADITFSKNGVVVDLARRTVRGNQGIIDVTPQEFELLEVLIINRNIALSREKLLELAWGYDYAGETRTVDSHIQRLRMKLGFEDVIKTVYKLGYRLED